MPDFYCPSCEREMSKEYRVLIEIGKKRKFICEFCRDWLDHMRERSERIIREDAMTRD